MQENGEGIVQLDVMNAFWEAVLTTQNSGCCTAKLTASMTPLHTAGVRLSQSNSQRE